MQFTKKIMAVILICFFWAAAAAVVAQVVAFPGAEGGGKFTTGGRGGAVYEVTNLNDSGAGSLREAVNQKGARTIVFRVSGTIQLKSDLNVKNGDLTIAGQTAPGDGICLRDQTLVINASNVILRHLRFRLGDVMATEDDAIWGRYRKNILIDHCSASWSVDECMSFYGNDSTTIQWCIISESLYLSTHSKGAHGYGGIWGGKNVSFHHNLFAHHSSRTPRFDGSNALCINMDFRNNVIYNWGFNSGYGGEGGTINIVANYYKAGPATKSGVRYRIVQPSDGKGKWFVEENYVDGSPAITANNWAGGVQGSYCSEAVSRAYVPHPYVPINQHSAEEAYQLVLAAAGATLPKRDRVDERIVSEVFNGTATYDGKGYERTQGMSDTSVVRGIIDSQTEVGGWPELYSLPAPADNDHDGMPDAWELAHGLDPADASDRNLVTVAGYTQLEVYLNSLTGPVSSVARTSGAQPSAFSLSQNYPNPFNQRTTFTVAIPQRAAVNGCIYDLAGRRVLALIDGEMAAGVQRIPWHGVDDQQRRVASGIYFLVVRYRQDVSVIKFQLIR